MHYQLYYWTGLQGRGEFVRLALEDAGAAYTHVARIQGDEAMTAFLQGEQVGAQPFAPPFLKGGGAGRGDPALHRSTAAIGA